MPHQCHRHWRHSNKLGCRPIFVVRSNLSWTCMHTHALLVYFGAYQLFWQTQWALVPPGIRRKCRWILPHTNRSTCSRFWPHQASLPAYPRYLQQFHHGRILWLRYQEVFPYQNDCLRHGKTEWKIYPYASGKDGVNVKSEFSRA